MTKRAITKDLRFMVWDANGGKGLRSMLCYTGCGREICIEMFHCGHVIAESRGGLTTLTNLKPICSLCNMSMKTTNMHEYIKDRGTIGENIADDIAGDIVEPVVEKQIDDIADDTHVENKIHNLCGKEFNTVKELNQHKNRKTPCLITEISETDRNNPNRCIHCNKIFVQHQSLNRHHKTCRFKIKNIEINNGYNIKKLENKINAQDEK